MLAKPLLLVDITKDNLPPEYRANFCNHRDMDYDEADISHDEDEEEEDDDVFSTEPSGKSTARKGSKVYDEEVNPSSTQTSEVGPLNLKKNKRKNFLPRNINDYSLSVLTTAERDILEPTSTLSDAYLSMENRNGNSHVNDDQSEIIDLSSKSQSTSRASPNYEIKKEISRVPPKEPSPQESSTLKDYAENTMKELLGIYGLNDISDYQSKSIAVHKASRETNGPPAFSRHPHLFLPKPISELSQTPIHPLGFAPFPISPAMISERGLISAPGVISFASPLFDAQAQPPHYFVPKSSGNVEEPGPSGAAAFGGIAGKEKSSCHMDYTRYVKRFGSAMECGLPGCREMNYREHFHCVDCNSRVFVKKEEMIRHFKWHKKRDESLQHGFMRYSPTDDCSDRFTSCSHNRKQTHYHCLKEGCDKVYISTSDVQMHANYHRKDSAILQEGFQRFRGCEDCGQSYCCYQGQKTTHFHCRRQGCQFTFKNKGDMDKHKSYHIKDDQLNKDGFKKYMKHEDCPFKDCRFSRVCNHIHCIRKGCAYVLHSSGQLYSHKRKHERRDTEMAYRKYQLTQSLIMGMELGTDRIAGPSMGLHSQLPQATSLPNTVSSNNEPPEDDNELPSNGSYPRYEISEDSDIDSSTFDTKIPLRAADRSDGMQNISDLATNLDSFDNFTRFVVSSREASCPDGCEMRVMDHYHCKDENCLCPFASLEGAKEHARNHIFQEMITQSSYTTIQVDSPCSISPECLYQGRLHHHCMVEGCKEVVVSSDKPFQRLEHYNVHEYSRQLPSAPLNIPISAPIDGIFRRKRGRPPKNRIIELPMSSSSGNSSTALFTSFKLPKPSPDSKPPSSAASSPSSSPGEMCSLLHLNSIYHSLKPKPEVEDGFYVFDGLACPDRLCPHQSQKHYHCAQPRCFYVTDRADILILHSKDFHDNIYILEGFNFFDRCVDCRYPNCVSNKINRHFHCTRPGCGFSFVRYSTMSSHEKQHQSEDLSEPEKGFQDISSDKTNGISPFPPSSPGREAKVKAAGTYYPLSAFPMSQPSNQGRVQLSPKSLAETTAPSRPEDNVHISKTSTDMKMEARPSPTPVHGMPTGPPVIFPGGMYPSHFPPSPQIMYSPENACGRPFCKLKRKDHYHCHICSQAFTEYEKLHSHILKHITCGPLDINPDRKDDVQARAKLDVNSEPMDVDNSFPSPTLVNKFDPTMPSGPSLPPYIFPPGFGVPIGYPLLRYPPGALLRAQTYVPCSVGGYSIPLPRAPQLPSPSCSNGASDLRDVQNDRKSCEISEDLPTPENKKCRLNPMRILKDEPVPEGYIRYRFNEDCGYPHCGYREHQTHFHCTRKDCGYSFCDKTRFVQHTARHERLDTLMGGDFHQYRSTISCGRPDCDYTNSAQNKSSHFHCLKCDFVCTDTNKVVAHRRQHQKLDSIMAAGFEKFTPSQNCSVNGCQHNHRQTHYHCIQCHFAVLGLSQMSAHRYRHERQ